MKKITILDIMRYYVNYYDYEHSIVQAVHSNAVNLLDLFKKYKNGYMKVGRNFVTGKDEAILNEVLSFEDFEGNYVKIFSDHLYTKDFLSGKNKNALSASSKFLWLRKPETIILDTNNRSTLNIQHYDYEFYCEVWKIKYEGYRDRISALIENYSLEKIDPIFGEEWFKMRVFDQFLWSIK